MKVVVNKTWGGFDLPDHLIPIIQQKYGDDFYYTDDMEVIKKIRTNKQVVEYFSLQPEGTKIQEVPDEATDWMIVDYDGMESLYYVLNGKIIRV